MDEQRAEFEAWATQLHYALNWREADPPFDEGYDTGATHHAYKGWQAATQRQQERIAYVEKVADDAIELGNQQAIRIAELQAQVQALNAMKLDKPAQVGGGVFGVGVSVQHVIRAAQWHYEYQSAQAVMTQEQRVDEERKRRAFWDLIHGPLDAAIAAGKGEG